MHENKSREISNLVQGRLPEFIRVDHPTLIAFLEAYYEWLQDRDRTGKIISPMILQDVIDVDRSLDDFISHFKKEYLFDFPEKLAISQETGKPVDIRKLIKNIKAFYRAKGTEKSYEFLFRILYDTGVEFYYPKRDILRVSDGKWLQKTSLKVTNVLGDRIFESVGRIVYQTNQLGQISSSGKVLDVSIYRQGQNDVAELTILGRNGSFTPGSRGIDFKLDNGEILRELRVYDVVGSVSITNAGSGYVIGDRLKFTSATGDSGEGARASVSLVSSSGAIRRIKMDDFGINYLSAPTVTIESLSGTGFVGVANTSAICEYEGYYINSDGRVSTNKVLQDNHYYQDYSYVLKSEIVIEEYREAIRRLVHPAGTAMFGQVLIKRCAREDLDQSSALIRFEVPIIGHYTPYTFNTFDNLPDWFSIPGTGASSGYNVHVGYNPAKHDSLIQAVGVSPVPRQQGNPIANIIPFVEATGPSFTPLGLTGYKTADPFWIIYEHPNRKISDIVIAQVWKNQIDDFYQWPEWTTITGGSPPVGWTADFYGASGTSAVNKKYALLKYNELSAFRKITARSFFNMPIGNEFDCRTEDRVRYAKPIVSLIYPLNTQRVVTPNRCEFNAQILISNYENLPKFGVTSASKIRFTLSGSRNEVRVVNINDRNCSFQNLTDGPYSLKVEVTDSNGKGIQGISDTVVFEFYCSELTELEGNGESENAEIDRIVSGISGQIQDPLGFI
jgi:hypothetical protein